MSSCTRHDPLVRRFVNKFGDDRVLLKLQAARDSIRDARVIYRSNGSEREQALERLGHIADNEFFGGNVLASEPIDYVFHLDTAAEPRWLTPQGLQLNSAPPESWFRFDPQAQGSFDTPGWVRDAIFYQIFPDRFCNGNPRIKPPAAEPWGAQPSVRNFMGGDLQGILDQLEYLDDLGINALYLTPIFRSASNHKYDTIDYFTVDPHFGDTALLKELVRSCHARGIRVILDAVFNHCSNLHPFFLDVKEKGRASRYWNWFFIKKWPIPDHYAKHKDALEWYECWWGYHTLPKLDYTNPEVEEYFLKVAQHWLREADIDGWRLDVPNEVIQTFWPKFRAAVKQVNPQAYIVGEIWDDATPWLNGDQFDAVMNYRFQKALIGYFAEETMDTISFDQALRQVMLDYPEQATSVMLNLLGSHDTVRPMTVAKGKIDSIQLTAAMQFTFEGAPCIYYGDEIGLEGGKDPDCRRCYPWDQPELQNRELLAYYKKLIAIRKANPALRTGTFHPFLVDNALSLYAFERRAKGNRCIVALNRDKIPHELKLPSLVLATELITGQQMDTDHFTVPARQAVILRVHA